MSEGDHGRPPVGSVAEEAAKLLGALQGWAHDAGRAEDRSHGAGGAFRHLNEHIATGDRDCTYCPVCQVIGIVRDTSPEVRQHLASAATSLMSAASGLLAAHGSEPARGQRGGSPLEHIDLSEDEEWEGD